jgi:hypothetical protein
MYIFVHANSHLEIKARYRILNDEKKLEIACYIFAN